MTNGRVHGSFQFMKHCVTTKVAHTFQVCLNITKQQQEQTVTITHTPCKAQLGQSGCLSSHSRSMQFPCASNSQVLVASFAVLTVRHRDAVNNNKNKKEEGKEWARNRDCDLNNDQEVMVAWQTDVFLDQFSTVVSSVEASVGVLSYICYMLYGGRSLWLVFLLYWSTRSTIVLALIITG